MPARSSYPPALEPLVEGLADADVFELDERLQRALAREQGLDARIGSLLTVAWERWVHRALGYATREAYARERLGMDPTRARSLVRLERTAEQNTAFARAYREGGLSRVKASVLAPLVSLDPLGGFVGDWVSWAGRVTVRRLREDVEQAVALAETDPLFFRHGGGLPAEAHDDRAIGAKRRGPGECPATADPDAGVPGHEADAEAGAADRAIGAKRRGRRGRPLENRVTLCAFHHLRGVHAGLVRCQGLAPDGLRWEMGIRSGAAPRLAYRSGDLLSLSTTAQ